jgi:hypothetical protein
VSLAGQALGTPAPETLQAGPAASGLRRAAAPPRMCPAVPVITGLSWNFTPDRSDLANTDEK